MFTIAYREHVRQRILEMGRGDPRVTAGAFIGSRAHGPGDRWSDVDVGFGIAGGTTLETVLEDWTEALSREFGVLDHFDMFSGPSIYRVFLLPGGLQVDVSVTPEEQFGARGPNFRTLFGTTHQVEAPPQPSVSSLTGPCWHHVLHARSCIERGKLWQAEYWISEIRDSTLALACIRLGENALYGRGLHRLPASVTDPLVGALVRSLDEPELRRALAVATRCLIVELEQCDPTLCARLKPVLQEFGDGAQPRAAVQSEKET